MKKVFLVLSIGLAIFASSCKKKADSNATPQGVADNKKAMETQGVALTNKITAMKTTKAGTAIQNLSSLFSSSALKADVVNSLPIGKLLAQISSNSTDGTVSALKSSTSSSIDFKSQIGKAAATYTYNKAKNSFDTSAAEAPNVIKVLFPGSSTSTTNNAEFKVYGLGFTSVSTKNTLYETNNAITACSAYLKVDGTNVMTYSLTATYDANGYPSSIATSLTVDVYSLNYNLTYTSAKATSDLSIKQADTVLMAQGFEFDGTLTEDKAKELNTYYNDTSTASKNATKIGEFVSAATVYYQVMDVKIIGSVDVKNFTTALDASNALNSNGFTSANADLVNKYCSLYAIFASSNKKIADVTIYAKAVTTGNDPALMLNFPDGSKADLQTYVQDPNNFADFRTSFKNLVNN